MNQPRENYDAIVLGGGAAGLMCAIEAGKRGRRVLVIEHNDAVGKKIRISGGGRCNFTNLHTDPKRFISNNPRFCYSALSRYTPADFIAFVERHGIAYHEKKLGQLFCDGSAQGIIDALLNECAEGRVEIRLACSVQKIEKNDELIVTTTQGIFRAPALVVATGGLLGPKTRHNRFRIRLLAIRIAIVPCRPGLVPFTLASRTGTLAICRYSFDAVSVDKTEFEKGFVTHRGHSGPAILQISSYWEAEKRWGIDLFPGALTKFCRSKTRCASNAPQIVFGRRFPLFRAAFATCAAGRARSGKFGRHLRAMAESLHRWRIAPAARRARQAEVTCGGRHQSARQERWKKDVRTHFSAKSWIVTGWLGGITFNGLGSGRGGCGDLGSRGRALLKNEVAK